MPVISIELIERSLSENFVSTLLLEFKSKSARSFAIASFMASFWLYETPVVEL